jgi:prepilin peptidase CpaA
VANKALWILSAIVALTAGVTDARWRRIPNWLTYPSVLAGILLHTIDAGWHGLRLSLLGAALGLGLLLPFVLIRSLGGGDWKLIGALGALFGYNTAIPFLQQRLMIVLLWTLVINGVMALCLVILKRRAWQTLRNIGRMAAALFRVHLPPPDLTIDNPETIKVPFGVAAAVAILLYTSKHLGEMF